MYVIGTEVPVPGGAHETLDRLTPTSADRARRTIAAHRAAFAELALQHVWPRVMALVVQPGVEFDHLHVIDYDRSATVELRRVLDGENHLVFEAHSTDYQRPAQLRELVEDHWAVLKVGPALTFAMREALFALALIEAELIPRPSRSNLIEVVERRMLAEPDQWQGYYSARGDPLAQRTARRYSYSDRLRYYWADAEVDAARRNLLSNLDGTGIPMPLISQFLPYQYDRIRAGELEPVAQSLVIDRIRDAMRPYARACRAASSQYPRLHWSSRMTVSMPAQRRRRRNHSRDRPAARCLARGRGSRQRGGGRVPARGGRPSRPPDHPHRRGQLGVRSARSRRPRFAATSAAASRPCRRPTSSPARSIYLEPHTPTLMVSFGRSGNSPESLATTALADELVDDVWHLILTCDPDGQLGRAHSGRAELLRPLHAGTHQRQRLRDDVEPHLDVVDVPAAARAGRPQATVRRWRARPSTSRVCSPTSGPSRRAKKQRFVYLGSGPSGGTRAGIGARRCWN